MSGEVWKTIETKVGKVRMAKAEGGGAEERRRKETSRKRGEEKKRKGQRKKESWKYKR